MKSAKLPEHPLPVGPLVDAMPEHQRTHPARHLHVGGHRWNEYVERGLTIEQADRYAVRIGLHPASVWDNWFEVIAADVDLTAVPA